MPRRAPRTPPAAGMRPARRCPSSPPGGCLAAAAASALPVCTPGSPASSCAVWRYGSAVLWLMGVEDSKLKTAHTTVLASSVVCSLAAACCAMPLMRAPCGRPQCYPVRLPERRAACAAPQRQSRPPRSPPCLRTLPVGELDSTVGACQTSLAALGLHPLTNQSQIDVVATVLAPKTTHEHPASVASVQLCLSEPWQQQLATGAQDLPSGPPRCTPSAPSRRPSSRRRRTAASRSPAAAAAARRISCARAVAASVVALSLHLESTSQKELCLIMLCTCVSLILAWSGRCAIM